MSAVNKHSVTVVAVLLVIMLTVVPFLYLKFLDIVAPHEELKFIPGWAEDTFNATWYQNPVWEDTSFNEGWSVSWALGQSGNSSGFSVSNQTLTMYATFADNGIGVSGIVLQKNISELDTTESPYLVIRHKEGSSDPALMFSFGITDINGTFHSGDWHNVSFSWTYLESDLRNIFNGTITAISVRLTDGFNSNYTGGIQYASLESVAIYGESPDWEVAQSEPVYATVSSENGVLKVSAFGNVLAKTTVAAQRTKGLTFNLTTYDYLEVSIMTPSINDAARIVVWSEQNQATTVLVKTYDDHQWHTEIIDLSFFGLTSHVYMLELGFVQVYPSNDSWILYKQISFNNLSA